MATSPLSQSQGRLSVPLTFAVVLAAGLFVFTPAIALLLRTAGVSGFLGPLIGIGLSLGVYTAAVAVSRHWFVGALVALLMTSTYAANVPLIADTSTYPGALGPALWVFQAPLLAAVVLAHYRQLWRLDVVLPEVLLFGFVIWTFIVALLGDAPRPDVAIYFTFFFAQVFVVFALVSRSVRAGIAEFRDIVIVYCITTIGHVGIAFVQFTTQGPLGLSVLGETSKRVGTIGVGPIVMRTGTFVSGFAAGGLNSLIVLTLPLIAVLAWRAQGWRRVTGAVLIAVMLVVQRGTGTDSARGATILVGLLFLAGLGWLQWESDRPVVARLRHVRAAGGLLAAATVVLFPASGAGKSSDPDRGVEPAPESTPKPQPDPTTPKATTVPTPETEATETTATPDRLDVSDATELVDNVSVPFFNLSSLSVRVRQYAGGLDLFARHPLFGIGGGNFMYFAESYGLDKPYRIHNLYIALLAETGIPGLLLYLGTVGTGLIRGAKLVVSRSVDHTLVFAVCCGLVGLLAAAFWGPFLDRLPRVFPFWAIMGALVGEAQRVQTR